MREGFTRRRSERQRRRGRGREAQKVITFARPVREESPAESRRDSGDSRVVAAARHGARLVLPKVSAVAQQPGGAIRQRRPGGLPRRRNPNCPSPVRSHAMSPTERAHDPVCQLTWKGRERASHAPRAQQEVTAAARFTAPPEQAIQFHGAASVRRRRNKGR